VELWKLAITLISLQFFVAYAVVVFSFLSYDLEAYGFFIVVSEP